MQALKVIMQGGSIMICSCRFLLVRIICFFTEERGHVEPQFKWRSRYWSFLLKLSKDLPSWTIQARRSNNMGPFHWRSRILRISEIKRLQTFPDNYHFSGSIEKQWRQIGNAVPPLVAEVFGKAIFNSIR
ncbi:DNA cytosine methyltransferase [Xanthomonas citri]|uniref:DNA cytosine methyltransferase n=2 Tax=Xanthomonas citri TaxID=346 RepID=UPI0028F6F907|nr:DNA cytosine methyltransferase [Xanthomonas citri]